jgi:tetratricopeptide (TPR) repeat protein
MGRTPVCTCIPGWVWDQPEMRQAVGERDTPAVLRLLRQYLPELSQEAVGRICGISQTTVHRAELGTGLHDRRLAHQALTRLLPTDLSRDDAPGPHSLSDMVAGAAAERVEPGGIERLRQLVDVYDLPSDGPTRSVGDLQHVVTRLIRHRLDSQYSQLLAELPQLLPELTRALYSHQGRERRHVARLLVQAYRAADAVADKAGLHDLSARTIQVMLWAAEQTEDDITCAAAAYVRAETFFTSGNFEPGRRMLERASQGLDLTTPRATAAYGALHMRAAVLAARGGSASQARDHLSEARTLAAHTSEGVYTGTAFGPGSVRVHEVTLALELGDPHHALATVAGWTPPTDLPAERRSHFYIDLALAQARTGRHELALDALDTAWKTAPEHTRLHPQVSELLTQMMRSGQHTSAARAFATTAGVTTVG